MSMRISITSIVLFIFSSSLMLGQGDQCQKLKIAVINKGVYNDSTLYYLNKIHNKNWSIDTWITEIDSKILEELNKAGYGDLEFFSPKTNTGNDIDLKFLYDLYLWSVDKDNPENKYANTYIKDNVLYSTNQQMVFMIRSQLEIFSSCYCGPSRNYILSNRETYSVTIYQAVKNLVSLNWPMDRMIWQWESEHLAPAREPKMEIRYEKEYLSLLDEESRKMEVYIKVKNCRGVYVYTEDNGQPVYFLKEMERLEYKDGKKCNIGPDCDKFSTVYTNSEYEAIGEYKVIKGLEATKEKPRFKTCGIGNNSIIEHEGEIIVLGLKLEVEPDRNTIHNGEQTSIQIDLHELDPDGTEILSCSGKEVDVKVTGLVDGTISHKSGKITLNEVGVAFIDYKAGKQDKQIKISATFTPPGYPEEVKGEATINVKPMEYEATLTIKGSYTNTQYSSYSKEDENGTQRGNSDLKEIQAASFYIPLRMERADDVPMLNQRWEYYSPVNINLTTSTLTYRHKKYDYASYKTNHGFEQTVTRNKNPVRQEISGKETLEGQMNIILVIDKETSKVVKIITGGYGLDFYWKEDYKIIGYSWDEDGKKPINKSESKTDDISSQFVAGPVEDEVPDPTAKSVAESLRTYLKNLGTPLPADIEIPEDEGDKAEIRPDLLVEFGDGKTSFGGDGKRILDNSKGSSVNRQEWTFNWQVTRRKK